MVILTEIYAVSKKILKISSEVRRIRQLTRRDFRVYCHSPISGSPLLIFLRVRALSWHRYSSIVPLFHIPCIDSINSFAFYARAMSISLLLSCPCSCPPLRRRFIRKKKREKDREGKMISLDVHSRCISYGILCCML